MLADGGRNWNYRKICSGPQGQVARQFFFKVFFRPADNGFEGSLQNFDAL
jgi:hypothetical protein